MIKNILLSAIFQITCIFSFAQNIADLISEHICLLESYDSLAKNPSKKFGTGTIIFDQIKKETFKVILITNKHVLPNKAHGKNLYFKFKISNEKNEKQIKTGIIDIWDENWKTTPEVYIDEIEDIAMINITNFFTENNFKIANSSFITTDLIATKDTMIKYSISYGKEVFFMGYPSFYYNKVNFSPIFRTGKIATNPLEDFYFNDEMIAYHYNKYKTPLPDKLSGFLIDANANAGSSGSLVFVTPELYPFAFQGRTSLQITKPYIVGIFTYSYFSINDFESPKTNLPGIISADAIHRSLLKFRIKNNYKVIKE